MISIINLNLNLKANFMKNLLLLSYAILQVSYTAFSQCQPVTAFTNLYQPIGLIPLPTDGQLEPSQFFCYPGQPFDQILTTLAPQTATIANPIGFPPTVTVNINWIRVTNIQNLPTWVSYSCGGQLDPADPCKMAFPTWSCVRAYSNAIDGNVPMTEIPGTIYPLNVIVDADVSPLGTQSNYAGGSISLFVLDNMSLGLALDSCNGGQIVANALGGFGDPSAYEYAWSNGSTTQTISGLSPGWITCTVNDQVTNWTATDSVYVGSVLNPILVSAVVNQPTNNDGSIAVTATGGNGSFSFLWSGPNGFTASTAAITNLTGGVYMVTISNQNGCSIQESYFLSGVSVDEVASDNLQVFPNPSSNFVLIKNANKSQTIKIELYSMDGKLVQKEKLYAVNSVYRLNFRDPFSGKYLLKMYTGEKIVQRYIVINL